LKPKGRFKRENSRDHESERLKSGSEDETLQTPHTDKKSLKRNHREIGNKQSKIKINYLIRLRAILD
jgi:hypothetical protein